MQTADINASQRSRKAMLLALIGAAALAGSGLAACSSSSTSSPATTAAGSSTTAKATSSLAALPKLSAQRAAVAAGVKLGAVPESVLSQLSTEAKSSYFGNGCEQSPGAFTKLTPCVSGDQASASTVVVFGDSFSAQWAPALSALGTHDGFKVVVYSRLGCQFGDITTVSYTGTVDPGCDPFRQAVISAVNAMSPAPAMVILAQEHALGLVDGSGAPISREAFATGVSKTVSALTSPSKVVLVGNPVAQVDPATCLSAHSANAAACNTSLASVVAARPFLKDANAAKAAGATPLNVATLMCTTQCPAVISATPVYADRWHITTAFASASTDALGDMLGCTATVGITNSVTTSLQGTEASSPSYAAACRTVLSTIQGPLAGS